MTLLAELKRRNVFRVGAAYIVVAWVVVEVADTLRDIFPGIPIWIVQALIVLLAVGLLPVLIFAWFYELTPDGLKRDSDVVANESLADAAGRKLIYLTVAAVFVGVALFAWKYEEPDVDPDPPGPQVVRESIAVLPFINMSGNPDNEYFSDGLTETLLHMLAQVQGLKVPARTSVFAFKDKDVDIRQIAETLGVAHVLEGSVQRAGDTVRVTAQLIAADDGAHLWSGKFDREVKDIFAIQDEIASQVGIILLAQIWNPADVHSIKTDDFLAYELFLKARAAKGREGFEPLQSAERLLREALAKDPSFLDAKVLLAEVLMLQADNGFRPPAEAYTAARSLLGEILTVDPEHTWARLSAILLDGGYTDEGGEFEPASQALPKIRLIAAEAPGDAEVRKIFARIAMRVAAPEEAMRALEQAAEVDPLSAEIYFWMATVQRQMLDFESMRNMMLRAVDLEPRNPAFRQIMGEIELMFGEGERAIRNFVRAMDLDPLDEELPGSIADLLYGLGLVAEARPFHDRVLDIAPESEEAVLLEMREAWASGDKKGALEMARQVIRKAPYDRWRAWDDAWQLLLLTSVQRGTEQEDIALFDTVFPDFSNLEVIEVPGRAATIRAFAIDVLIAVKGKEAVRTWIKRTMEHFGEDPSRDKQFPVPVLYRRLVMDGPDAAIEWALEGIFSRPMRVAGHWKLTYARPFLEPVVDDPRVQAALARWDKQEAEIRNDVRDFFANLLYSEEQEVAGR